MSAKNKSPRRLRREQQAAQDGAGRPAAGETPRPPTARASGGSIKSPLREMIDRPAQHVWCEHHWLVYILCPARRISEAL
jgi:hypothetical protein